MPDIFIIFALAFAGLVLVSRKQIIYALLAFVLAGYLVHPALMESLAQRWFSLAASPQAAEILIFIIIAVLVLAILGPRHLKGRSSSSSNDHSA